MRVRIQLVNIDADPDFYLMRMRIRMQIQVTKMMRILENSDPQHWFHIYLFVASTVCGTIHTVI